MAREEYLPISNSEHDIVSSLPPLSPLSYLQKTLIVFSTILGASSLIVLGYFCGSYNTRISTTAVIESAGNLHYYMHFNETYPQRSNEQSDAAWESLFPKKLGFVQHPTLAPNVSGIAVFHELHCLDILRRSFWASVDGTLENMGSEAQEKNLRTSYHHIRHCFEYLRQSLVCLADSNLEHMNYTARGVSGWQSERTCRDFDQLSSWADEWGISREEALHNFDLQANFLEESHML